MMNWGNRGRRTFFSRIAKLIRIVEPWGWSGPAPSQRSPAHARRAAAPWRAPLRVVESGQVIERVVATSVGRGPAPSRGSPGRARRAAAPRRSALARGAKNIERLRSPRPIFPTISDRKTAKPNESGFVLIERSTEPAKSLLEVSQPPRFGSPSPRHRA